MTSEQGRSARQEESRQAYQAAQYKDRSGKTVSVAPDSHTAQTVRRLPPERVQQHNVYVTNYYSNNRFPHPYDYYYSRPYVNLGCGYSSVFWWTLMDLDMHQRALWFYNNESLFYNGQLNRQLYDEQMQNAQLRGEVEALRSQRVQQQAGYLPPQFAENPDLALDSDYVNAVNASNHTVVSDSSGFWTFLKVVGWLAVIGLFGWALVYFVFVRRYV